MDQLVEFVRGLPSAQVHSLYAQPCCSLLMLTALPDMAKHICARLAFVQQPFDVESILDQFASTSHTSVHQALTAILRFRGSDDFFLMQQLIELHIVAESLSDEDSMRTLSMAPAFRKSFTRALTHGQASAASVSVKSDVSSKHRKKREELATYALERWECVLQFLAVCTEQTIKDVSVSMKEVLRHGRLVRTRGDDSRDSVEITSAGFQFLLMPKSRQLWTYLLHNISLEQSRDANVIEQLVTLCRLMFLDSEQPYSSQGLDEELLIRCREIGLVFMRKRKDGWFYVTPLVQLLTGGATWDSTLVSPTSSTSGSLPDQNLASKFIVLETNYRVYAYTDSMLQLSILSTFCDMTYRFGNMAVGNLTRESVRNALQVGITAEQIISYLNEHMRQVGSDNEGAVKNAEYNAANGLVAATVADQLRLWELERNRFTFEEAVMYNVFESDAEYENMVRYLRPQGWLLWHSDASKVVVVPSHAHARVKDWFKKNKHKF